MSIPSLFIVLIVLTLATAFYGVSSARYFSYIISARKNRGKNSWFVIILDLASIVSLGIGAFLLALPIALYWWINGNEDRKIWIINGPYPYSHFGGGPYQAWIGLVLLLSGLVVISLGLTLRRWFYKQFSHVDQFLGQRGITPASMGDATS